MAVSGRSVRIKSKEQRIDVARELIEANMAAAYGTSDRIGYLLDLLDAVLAGRAVAVECEDGSVTVEVAEEAA